MKAKVMAWLLTLFIFAQSTIISYHTEAFVKTEVGCTVAKVSNSSLMKIIRKISETPKAQFFWSSRVSCKPHLIKTRALCSLIEILFPGCVIVLHYSTPYMGLDVWFFHSNRCLDSLLEPVTVLLAWLQWKKI